jgi:hypothetical protein
MYYKEDWEQAKKRMQAFWNHEIIDRCCVGVHAPRKTSKLPPFPEQQWGPWTGGLEEFDDDDHTSIKRWWVDPEQNYNRMITWFENTYFGGEAIPCTYVNWGAMAMAGFYGSNVVFGKSSVWYPKVIENWETWKWEFDPDTSEHWLEIQAIVDYLLDHCNGRYFIGTPELGNGADLLSLLRGMDSLALDLLDHPDEVKKGVDALSDTWVDLMEQVHLQTYEANNNGGVLAWMGLWAPGRIDQIACDFSTVISPAMFEEFFVPEIEKMGNWSEYGTYHLDGPDSMKRTHDILLKIDQINTIQFTPGAADPPTYSPQYIPRYRKTLESGKNLYLLVKPHEIEPILAELPPEGLYLRTDVATEEEANDLLKKVEKWSAKRNSILT